MLLSSMAKEESHAHAVETPVTVVSASRGSSASTEETRKYRPPPANSDSSSRTTCPARESKRTTAEEEDEELDEEEEYDTVSAATTLHKEDIVDYSSRHLHHGNSASLQPSLRIGSARKAAAPRELFSSQEFGAADAPLAAPNGRAGEENAQGTGSAARGTPAASQKATGGGEEKERRGGADGVDNLRSGQPAAAAELVMAGRRQDVAGASPPLTKPEDGPPKAAGRTGGRPPAAGDALNMKMKEGAQADHGEGATTTSTTTTTQQQEKHLLEAEQHHQQQQEQHLHGQQMGEQQEVPQQDDDGCGAEEAQQQGQEQEQEQPVVCPRYLLEPLPVVPPAATLSDYDIRLLHEARHSDPFGVLGPHEVVIREPPYENKKVIVVRAWVRNAERIRLQAMAGHSECVLPGASVVVMEKRAEFLFEKAFIVHHLASQDPASSSSLSFCTFSSQQQENMQQPQEEETERDYGPAVASGDPGVKFQYQLLCLYTGDPSREERLTYDTYSFGMLLPTFDLELFQSGSCWHVDNLLGSHCVSVGGVAGVRFAVWAPAARRVAVVGDWNGWDGRVHPMRKRLEFGVWELFIPLLQPGEKYNYQITARDGHRNFFKIDPYAQEFEVPPKTASIISACDDAFKKPEDRFQWTDGEWMRRRKRLGQKELRRQPMAIYEVHLPSWMRGDNNTYLSYRELADRLVDHVKNMNFTHVEFLPLAHHPFEGSWGYQVTGQYAPYSRLGSPDDFKYLVNTLHRSNIGVFLDFVPAHFCKDSWGLAQYDGEACYEYADPREGEHKLWGTLVFNFRRNEVRSFLLGAAYHWLRRYHIDGLRIDAVSSMLYKNHQRPAGEWIANEYGGDANLQAMSLLQELNWVVHKQFPGVFTMAEESTSWQGVTDQEKGLGFDAKWDLGWMNDTLSYLCLPLYKRPEPACHNKLTFRGLYMGHEKWVLPLSHDEVVSGKGSLLDKCGFQGSPFEDRVKTLKTLFGFQVGSPGRPLIFMGAEIGQGREWSHQRSVDWHEGQEELRKKLCLWLSDLLAVYAYHPALHAGDDEPWNFKWTDCDNHNDCVIAFLRSYQEWYNDILVVCNFSPNSYYRYPVGVPHGGAWQVVLNSDDWRYAGGMVGPGNLTYVHTTQGGRLGWPYCLWLDLPPFGCLYLKCPQPSSEKKPALVDQQPQREEEEKVDLRQGEQQQQQQPQEEEKKQHQQPSQKQQQDNAKDACTGSDSAASGCVSERQQLLGSASGFAAPARDSRGVPNGTAAATHPAAEQRQQQHGGKHSSK